MRTERSPNILIIIVLLSLSFTAKGFAKLQISTGNGAAKAGANVNEKVSVTKSFLLDSLTGVIELRDYRLKSGKRDDFIKYFKEHFVQSQNEAGAQILGQFRVKGVDDNFFWMRGFSSMAARSAYLPAFYYGPVWKQFAHGANELLSNNDDVYLLKPLTWKEDGQATNNPVHVSIGDNYAGITVVDFYICNNKLDKMIAFVGKTYMPIIKARKVDKVSFWVSELANNDFPRLPVFQDKDLMVSISHYKDESEYKEKARQILQDMTAEQKDELDDIITKRTSLILYPAKK